MIEICWVSVLISIVDLLRTCILLFTSSGKLENQKTVLTNIGSQIKRGSLAMHALHWALKPRCHCWSRSTTSLQIHNWQLVSSFLQQMAVLKCVDGGWHVECLVICRLSVIFIEKIELNCQTLSEEFLGTIRFDIFGDVWCQLTFGSWLLPFHFAGLMLF